MDERMKILNMLAEGRLSPEEAAQLLEALGGRSGGPAHKPQWLRIRVAEDGREKVKVNIPLSLARMGIALLPDAAMVQINAKGIDLNRLLDEELPAAGKIVDIQDGNNSVEVFVE
jgi:hypothetical protein